MRSLCIVTELLEEILFDLHLFISLCSLSLTDGGVMSS